MLLENQQFLFVHIYIYSSLRLFLICRVYLFTNSAKNNALKNKQLVNTSEKALNRALSRRAFLSFAATGGPS
jgi:hypothetical protein